MNQLPLYIDAAAPDRADRVVLADVQATPARRGSRGHYPQTDEEWAAARRKAFAVMEAERVAGTHSDTVCTVCSICRNWCDGIWFTESSGGQGRAGSKNYCRGCFEIHRPDATLDPDASPPPKHIPAPRVTRDRRAVPTFADLLLIWASVHFRPACEAYTRSELWEWEGRVLASIVRCRAEREPGWLFRAVLSRFWEDLVEMGDFIRRAGGYPIGDVLTFGNWVKLYRAAHAGGLV